MERRFWYGIGILLVFLALGLWAAMGMENMHRPVTGQLEQAAQMAIGGDLSTGAALAERAERIWQRGRGLTAALADHAPMEEIDSLFAQAKSYALSGLAEDFAAVCSRIAKLVAAIGEAHGLTWQNLF